MPVAAILPAVIGGAASLGAAALGASASKKASKAQSKAAKAAAATQEKFYEQSRTDLEPYRAGGNEAFYSLLDMYGLKNPNNPEGGQAFNPAALEAFRNSPDYQVALREGVGALDKSAAARGNLLSGGQIKAVERYGSDLASQKFGSYLDRLAHMAGIGENAAARTGANAMAAGGQIAGSQMALGEAQASGIMGENSAIQKGIDGFATNLASGIGSLPTGSAYKPHPLYG